MRVLLVQSPTGRPEAPIFPLGLAFLAGQLTDHVLRCVDLSTELDPSATLAGVLESFSPDVVCISLRNIDDSSYPVTFSYIAPFSELVGVLEEWEGKVVLGGTGFSIYPSIILQRFPRVDFGLPGEGEELLPALLDHIDTGRGISGWDGGRLLPWGQADLENVRPPNYALVDPSPYARNGGIGVQSRRGCAFNCTYCTYGFLSGKSFRPRPVEHVIAELNSLKVLGVNEFMFVDSVFNAPEGYFEELLDAIAAADLGLKWGAWLDESITPEQLLRMREAGAVSVDFSPDALTDRGLRLLGKRGKASGLYPAVRAARKAGLMVGVNFFNGNPGEGLFAFIGKIFFMLRARLCLGWGNTFVNIGTIRAYAHSPIAAQMVGEGLVEPDCDFFSPVFYRTRGPGDWLYRLFQRIRRARHGR